MKHENNLSNESQLYPLKKPGKKGLFIYWDDQGRYHLPMPTPLTWNVLWPLILWYAFLIMGFVFILTLFPLAVRESNEMGETVCLFGFICLLAITFFSSIDLSKFLLIRPYLILDEEEVLMQKRNRVKIIKECSLVRQEFVYQWKLILDDKQPNVGINRKTIWEPSFKREYPTICINEEDVPIGLFYSKDRLNQIADFLDRWKSGELHASIPAPGWYPIDWRAKRA